MAIDKTLKKKVIEDWQTAFPQFTLYAQNKLYRVIGSVLVGLEIITLPKTEEYRPHFVLYPLWKDNVKSNLDIPIILKEFYNKKGFQYAIPYEKHGTCFDEVSESVKKQIPLTFDNNISLKKLLSVIDEYSQTPPLSASKDSYLQAILQEAKLKIALSIGINEAEEILNQANKKKLEPKSF